MHLFVAIQVFTLFVAIQVFTLSSICRSTNSSLVVSPHNIHTLDSKLHSMPTESYTSLLWCSDELDVFRVRGACDHAGTACA